MDGYKSYNKFIDLGLNELAFGLRGKVGKNVDFSLIPSIKSNSFVTGLEIRYNLPNKKG